MVQRNKQQYKVPKGNKAKNSGYEATFENPSGNRTAAPPKHNK